jgi:hypothetical protein
MLRTIIASLLSLAATGCENAPTGPMDRDVACHEQADAWCAATGFAESAGCTTWYVHECEPSGPTGTISDTEQNDCLQAIADSAAAARTEPVSCMETWR